MDDLEVRIFGYLAMLRILAETVGLARAVFF